MQPLQFSETEIHAIAARLHLDPPDAERLAILRCAESCEVQSGPGSGKTTLLAAKLALLADQWRDAHHGVCVLSHTNVARKEIESRLVESASLRRLLDYPHFIGTFQAFVDQFLALPLLRQKNLTVAAVDNDRFARRASAMYHSGDYGHAKGWLKHRGGDDRVAQIIGGLRFADGTLRVESVNYSAGLPASGTDTYKELCALKYRLTKQGYLRFDDMYALGERALTQFPYLLTAIRDRFPWVFVDELQDTSGLQGRLIDQLFPVGHCVVQCFGDKNQSIFDANTEGLVAPELFGRRKVLPLSSTRRFGPSIAALASRFTGAARQTLVGFPGAAARANTVFLFSRAAVGKVVPRFGDLVLSEVPPDIWRANEVCVVGSRKKVRAMKKDHFPLSLGDYWTGYNPDGIAKPQNPDSLHGFVVEARSRAKQTGLGGEGAQLATTGVLALLAQAGNPQSANTPRSRTALRHALHNAGTLDAFRQTLWRLLDPQTNLTAELWNDQMAKLGAALIGVLPSALDKPAQNFLAWHAEAVPVKSPTASADNIYQHASNSTTLPIRFDSIHSVKGETHAATLVVETFIHPHHDLFTLVPVLNGAKHGSELPTEHLNHCLRAFVGMTRATDLVCLALFRDHVTSTDIAEIEKCGWAIATID